MKVAELGFIITSAPLPGTADQLVALPQKLLPPDQVDCAKEESWAARNRSAGRNARRVRAMCREGIDFIVLGFLGVM